MTCAVGNPCAFSFTADGYPAPDFSVTGTLPAGVTFDGGARVVFRLSGTGTEGATLRVYLEDLETDPVKQTRETQGALAGIVAAADELAGISRHTGRTRPDVMT